MAPPTISLTGTSSQMVPVQVCPVLKCIPVKTMCVCLSGRLSCACDAHVPLNMHWLCKVDPLFVDVGSLCGVLGVLYMKEISVASTSVNYNTTSPLHTFMHEVVDWYICRVQDGIVRLTSDVY